jgi:hypothetical protein
MGDGRLPAYQPWRDAGGPMAEAARPLAAWFEDDRGVEACRDMTMSHPLNAMTLRTRVINKYVLTLLYQMLQSE